MNIIPKKKWGQNFLLDNNIIKKIVALVKLDAINDVLEIGPGKGALTKQLSLKFKNVYAVEIDSELCKYLQSLNISNLNLYNQDILKFNLQNLSDGIQIIGNLPYNISSPIIFKFLQNRIWGRMVIMLQEEVARRIIAKAGKKDYGRISIMVQSLCTVKYEFKISPHVFTPKPKVNSAIISIIPKPNIDFEFKLLERIVSNAFKHRRKKLSNNLKNVIPNKELEKIKDNRAEELTIEQYQALSKLIVKNKI